VPKLPAIDDDGLAGDPQMSQETIVEEVRALMIARHPDWAAQEWIATGVGCFCSEHAA